MSGAAGEAKPSRARQKVTGLLRTARRAAANWAPAGHAMAEGRALLVRVRVRVRVIGLRLGLGLG